MFHVRLVERDIDNSLYAYEAEIAPRVGDVLDWTADSGGLDVYRVVQVRHRLANMREEGTKFIGVMVVVDALNREDAYDVPDGSAG